MPNNIRNANQVVPRDDQDLLIIFVGDQQEGGSFASALAQARLKPQAFGFIYTPCTDGDVLRCVENTANEVGVPCFRIEEATFADAYAVPRTIRNLILTTPVRVWRAAPKPYKTLVESILETELLQKPVWA